MLGATKQSGKARAIDYTCLRNDYCLHGHYALSGSVVRGVRLTEEAEALKSAGRPSFSETTEPDSAAQEAKFRLPEHTFPKSARRPALQLSRARVEFGARQPRCSPAPARRGQISSAGQRAAEAKLPRRGRRSTQRLFEELRGRDYDGAYDSVHRFVRTWRADHVRAPVQAFVALSFDSGEANQ